MTAIEFMGQDLLELDTGRAHLGLFLACLVPVE
jgi:hypothetical protein